MRFSLWNPRGRTLASLVREAVGLSHRQVRSLVESGGGRVDGGVVPDGARRARARGIGGVGAARGGRRRKDLRGPGFSLLHLDEALIAVDKEPGVVVIPTGENDP